MPGNVHLRKLLQSAKRLLLPYISYPVEFDFRDVIDPAKILKNLFQLVINAIHNNLNYVSNLTEHSFKKLYMTIKEKTARAKGNVLSGEIT